MTRPENKVAKIVMDSLDCETKLTENSIDQTVGSTEDDEKMSDSD